MFLRCSVSTDEYGAGIVDNVVLTGLWIESLCVVIGHENCDFGRVNANACV